MSTNTVKSVNNSNRTFKVMCYGEYIGDVTAPSRIAAEDFVRTEMELGIADFADLIELVEVY
ncbi:hypothetical protein bas24_0075 [Escherichia phage SeppeHuegi]|nr:hypothetical protein bas24_0075 [Escherichia phage SeppeHuegi]